MTRPAYETPLYAWVRGVAAAFDVPAPTPPATIPAAHTVVVAWADQDAPRPKPPYVTLQVISTRALGRAERVTRPDNEEASGVVAEVVQRRQGQLEIQAYGAANEAVLAAIELSLRDGEVMGALRAAGVEVEVVGPRRRIGLVSGRAIEERSVAEATFRYVETSSQAVPGAVVAVSATLQPYTRTIPPQPPSHQPGGPAPVIQPPPTDTPDGDPFDFTITVPAPEEP